MVVFLEYVNEIPYKIADENYSEVLPCGAVDVSQRFRRRTLRKVDLALSLLRGNMRELKVLFAPLVPEKS